MTSFTVGRERMKAKVIGTLRAGIINPMIMYEVRQPQSSRTDDNSEIITSCPMAPPVIAVLLALPGLFGNHRLTRTIMTPRFEPPLPTANTTP